MEESTKIFKREIGDQGPLACATPAVTDGRLYVRMRDKLACYDLRTNATAQADGNSAATAR